MLTRPRLPPSPGATEASTSWLDATVDDSGKSQRVHHPRPRGNAWDAGAASGDSTYTRTDRMPGSSALEGRVDNPWDVAARNVLAENTAQAILKHLKRLEEKRSNLGARWIWELLQNARDAAKPAGVNVTVHLTAAELTFKHDGRPFEHEELAHLIFHGTTKLDAANTVGHFGSGFLSTHLLSHRVRLCGCVTDGSRFDFWLDRSSPDQQELATAMQRSMEECKKSCAGQAISESSTDTVFIYPLDDEARKLADVAIIDLRAWAPMVLALTSEIASISVSTESGRWHLERGERRALRENLELALLHLRDGGEGAVPQYIAVARVDDRVQAALPLQLKNDGLGVGLSERTPRVFVLFPLLGTERLALPAVLQSRRFEPVEDRDGIWLYGESSTASINRPSTA